MTYLNVEAAPMATARTAGVLYLVIAVFGMFSIGYMPSVVFTFGDASANAATIAANTGLFRLGIFADMLMIICELALTVSLYALLKPVNGTLSMMAAFARLGMIVVMGLNLINYLVPILLLSGVGYLQGFTADQLQGLSLLFLEAHEYGVYTWQIFFGFHLLVAGYLVLKSGYFPRILGTLMMIGSFGYSLQALEKFVLPDAEILSKLVIGFLIVVTIGEIGFAFWLLIKGLDIEKWNQRLKAAA